MPFTADERKKIKDNLTTRMRRELAEEFHIEVKSVQNILSGTKNNDELLTAAAEKIRYAQERTEGAKSFISSI
jgi:hypothetical protein